MRKKLLAMGTMIMAATMMMIPTVTAFAAEPESTLETNLVAEIEETEVEETVTDGTEVELAVEEDVDSNLEEDTADPVEVIVESEITESDTDENLEIEPRWVFTKKYKVTASSLNIRSKASTSGTIVGTLYKGDIINVKSIDNGWAKFKYNDQWRYVSATYIKAV